MVADVFGLHGRSPTDSKVDRGAKALRQLEQGRRLLLDWDGLRASSKRKWLDKARAVLRAALNPQS